MKSLQNFEFTVLVALILKHLLDGHGLSGFSDCCLEYDTEWTVTHNFLCIVCQTLISKLSENAAYLRLWLGLLLHLFLLLLLFEFFIRNLLCCLCDSSCGQSTCRSTPWIVIHVILSQPFLKRDSLTSIVYYANFIIEFSLDNKKLTILSNKVTWNYYFF